MASQLGSVLVDMRHIKDIRIPVLFLYGEKDARVQGGAEHRALFTGATDTKLVEVPAAGHYMGMARNAPRSTPPSPTGWRATSWADPAANRAADRRAPTRAHRPPHHLTSGDQLS